MTAYRILSHWRLATPAFSVLKPSGIRHSMKEIEELQEAIARDERRERMNPICMYCFHPRSEHCNAGTKHTNYKDDMKQAGSHIKQRTCECVSAHCKQPLCDCVEFI